MFFLMLGCLRGFQQKLKVTGVIICAFLMFHSAGSMAFTIAIVPKSSSDENQIAVARGCNILAKSDGASCKLINVSGDFQPRMQVHAITSLLRLDVYDAIAVSVTDSQMLAKVIENIDVPVITFDSDFSESFQSLRYSYVGVDDYQIGVSLGEQARRLLPEGGTVCIMSALHNENLARRLDGVRHALSQSLQSMPVYRLVGQQNWYEANRCPWNSGDDVDRALYQLGITLSRIKPDVLISVGDWAIREPQKYRAAISPYQNAILQGEIRVISANGALTKAHSQLIDESLVSGVEAINFELMGKQVYKTLKVLLENGEVDEIIHVGHESKIAPNIAPLK